MLTPESNSSRQWPDGFRPRLLGCTGDSWQDCLLGLESLALGIANGQSEFCSLEAPCQEQQ